jgi:hypothetical protein
MKQIVVLLIAVLSVSCAKKPTEIYKLKNTGYSKYFEEYAGWKTEPYSDWTYYLDQSEGWLKEEYYIIFNPPKDKSELMTLVAEFNRANLPKDSILKYNHGYRRYFFRKSRQTMKAYKEDKEASRYAFQIITDCDPDVLFKVCWEVTEEYGIIAYYYSAVHHISSGYLHHISDEEIYYPWLRDKNK